MNLSDASNMQHDTEFQPLSNPEPLSHNYFGNNSVILILTPDIDCMMFTKKISKPIIVITLLHFSNTAIALDIFNQVHNHFFAANSS